MKYQILINVILLSSILPMNSQTRVPNDEISPIWYKNEKVGIGTNNPTVEFDVNGDIKIPDANAFHGSIFKNNDYSTMTFMSRAWQSVQGSNGKAYSFQTHNNTGILGFEMMAIYYGETGKILLAHNGGNVGIGTTTPTVKLDVNGDLKIPDANAFYGSTFKTSDYSTMTFISRAWQSVQGSNGKAYSFQTHNNAGSENLEMMAIYYGETGKILLAHNGGNVGIGTNSPSYKLDVCGTIRANEIKVDLLGGCDFVFEKEYKLMDINTLEKFVTTKKHLPEIASEKEMIENGLNMKEFQMKLLQKIEELTLYTIEQNKKNEKQEEELKILKAEIKKIKSNKK